MSDKIVATVSRCVQIGPDDYECRKISKVFEVGDPVYKILDWAQVASKSMAKKTINDVSFSEYEE